MGSCRKFAAYISLLLFLAVGQSPASPPLDCATAFGILSIRGQLISQRAAELQMVRGKICGITCAIHVMQTFQYIRTGRSIDREGAIQLILNVINRIRSVEGRDVAQAGTSMEQLDDIARYVANRLNVPIDVRSRILGPGEQSLYPIVDTTPRNRLVIAGVRNVRVGADGRLEYGKMGHHIVITRINPLTNEVTYFDPVWPDHPITTILQPENIGPFRTFKIRLEGSEINSLYIWSLTTVDSQSVGIIH